ncbi:DUF1684 domain-containing protein [Arthrobacter roseus]|uniref:DUF1684 domain-containing protein n=1 Tax=Arthrobacter roseus TaxID=136274 RepID=UPI00196394B4|nr:DUF1684 domain-containing protein [Arthrobacter roseus]MBM7847573.1 uncharacterized protein (DUF1684 family) [Arthrobacter roseus]
MTTGEQAWKEWHEAREQELAADFGWLTLTSFQWLSHNPARIEGLPGQWSTNGSSADITVDESFGLLMFDDGQPVDGTVTSSLREGQSLMWVRRGDIAAELAVRNQAYAIRTRDNNAETRTRFEGVPTFDYSDDWVLNARFQAYPAPQMENIKSVREDIPLIAEAVGEVVFEVDGAEHRLRAEAKDDGGLTLNFHDATNGDATAAWRFVQTSAPEEDGSVVLDFNRTLNYPFAFTDFGACPAPMNANRLALSVPAGEKKPV